jgi:hypothetical protein
MDAALENLAIPSSTESKCARERPPRHMVEAAVRTLIEWAGDDPDREGLIDTPKRVVRAYERFFAGYYADPAALLSTTFAESSVSEAPTKIEADFSLRIHRGRITSFSSSLLNGAAPRAEQLAAQRKPY